MIKINTSTALFNLQARTELATTENRTTINATIFSAFAAKDQTGSTVQIEMSRDKKGKPYSSCMWYVFCTSEIYTFWRILYYY